MSNEMGWWQSESRNEGVVRASVRVFVLKHQFARYICGQELRGRRTNSRVEGTWD